MSAVLIKFERVSEKVLSLHLNGEVMTYSSLGDILSELDYKVRF
jgi:hypothetical protein